MHNLAIAQYRPPWGQPDIARKQLADLIDGGLSHPVDLVVAPEMATSGYLWPDSQSLMPIAEDKHGPTFELMSSLAKAHNAWIFYGYPEREGTRLYNSANLINNKGELLLTYRKFHLYYMDEWWASPSKELPKVDSPWGTLIPGICADINDDIWCKHAFDGPPALVPFCTNWVNKGSAVHSYWRERMGQSQSWLIAANRWGVEHGVQFSGESALLCANGPCLSAPPEGNGILLVQVDGEEQVSGRWKAEGVNLPRKANH